MKRAFTLLLILAGLTAGSCSEPPDKEVRYAAQENGVDVFSKPRSDSEKVAHAEFADAVKTGRVEKNSEPWIHVTVGDKRGWMPESSLSRVDPMISIIREKAAPLLGRNIQDVGVRRLEGSMYEVTNFALASGEMSATIYDLWLRTGKTASKTARLGPGRNLVQLHLNNDDTYDYLLEGGMPGTGHEYVIAFIGGAGGRLEKTAEVTAPSDEAPHITSTGKCGQTVVETTSSKPRRYVFDCAVNRFAEQK